LPSLLLVTGLPDQTGLTHFLDKTGDIISRPPQANILAVINHAVSSLIMYELLSRLRHLNCIF
jgi:hypothetical protein